MTSVIQAESILLGYRGAESDDSINNEEPKRYGDPVNGNIESSSVRYPRVHKT